MFAVISPAKKLDFETPAPVDKTSDIRYPKKSYRLIEELRKCSPGEIKKLMKLSDSLTELNVDRYKKYNKKFTGKNSKQAVFAFCGDTYVGLEASSLKKGDINYAQNHLGILSGLYGLLRPLDLIQPYRLEMGTKFGCDGGKNLYEYWGDEITKELNSILKKEKYLINLASNEYFSVIDKNELNGEIITPVFKEKKGDQYKVIGFSAKRARGMMARFIVENRIKDPEGLTDFNMADYRFNKKLSQGNELVFTK